MTICAKCKHHRTKQCGPKLQWYDWYCHAVERERSVDPVTGKAGFVHTNDLGRKSFTDKRYPNCREVNPIGKCQMFNL